jgi:ubiquinone/menaquinone biosynthesis C-methylase UbiE
MTSLEYLKDNHPDRDYFVNFVIESNIQTVLEVGAGSQFEAKTLRDRGQLSKTSYTIMDINEFWLKEGKQLMPEVNFKLGTINKIPFPENSFEVVYCRHVIEHQPYYEIPLKEMLRVSTDWVFLNVFRWSLQEDVIQRLKYYSNAYSLTKLLKFCNDISEDVMPFIILKSGRREPGENIKKNEKPFIRRTGDHMVILMRKHYKIPRDRIKEIGDLTKANIVYEIQGFNSSALLQK